MPFGLRNRDVLAYLVHEYVTFLECDMSSFTRSDILWCRILLDIVVPKILPSFQWIEYIHRYGENIYF
jgi:hypothetical protein